MQLLRHRIAGVAAAIVAAALDSARASAHHSTAEYDSKTVVEARGEVVTVLWANPPVRGE